MSQFVNQDNQELEELQAKVLAKHNAIQDSMLETAIKFINPHYAEAMESVGKIDKFNLIRRGLYVDTLEEEMRFSACFE